MFYWQILNIGSKTVSETLQIESGNFLSQNTTLSSYGDFTINVLNLILIFLFPCTKLNLEIWTNLQYCLMTGHWTVNRKCDRNVYSPTIVKPLSDFSDLLRKGTRMHSSRMRTIRWSGRWLSARGGCLPEGCLPRGSARHPITHPLWTEWQTGVKTSPCRNDVAYGKNLLNFLQGVLWLPIASVIVINKLCSYIRRTNYLCK